jgi:hypothetical protein
MTSAATRGIGAGAPSRPEAVLAALAAGILGPAYDPEVPRRMLEILDRLASRRDRSQLQAVLRALDSRAGALALTGRPAPVSGLGPAAGPARPGPPPATRGRSAPPPTCPGGWSRCRSRATRSWPATWLWSARGPGRGGRGRAGPGRPGRRRAREGRYAAERDFHSGEVAASLEAVAGRLGAPPARAGRGSGTSSWNGACGGSAGRSARCPATSAAAPRTPAAAGVPLAAGSGQAVHPGHLPGGGRRARRPAGRRGRRPPGPDPRRPGRRGGGGRGRRAPAGGAGAGRGGRRRGHRDPGPAAPVGSARAGRPPPAPAPRHRRHGPLRPAGPLVEGTLQARWSARLRERLGPYGPLFETLPLHRARPRPPCPGSRPPHTGS